MPRDYGRHARGPPIASVTSFDPADRTTRPTERPGRPNHRPPLQEVAHRTVRVIPPGRRPAFLAGAVAVPEAAGPVSDASAGAVGQTAPVGFFARIFGGGRPVDEGITSELRVSHDGPPTGTAAGDPAAVDELGRVNGRTLGHHPGGLFDPPDTFGAGAPSAIDADLGVGTSSQGDDLDNRQVDFWRALHGDPPPDADR